MRTRSIAPFECSRHWYLIDASDQVLGRLAVIIVSYLRGKHKAEYSHNVDCGDCVVVINVDKIRVTGSKLENKNYYHHSGYPGGLKCTSLREVMRKYPKRALQFAVQGMMPRGPLSRVMLKKLKIYSGMQHPHIAQQPRILNFT